MPFADLHSAECATECREKEKNTVRHRSFPKGRTAAAHVSDQEKHGDKHKAENHPGERPRVLLPFPCKQTAKERHESAEDAPDGIDMACALGLE